MLPVQRLLRTSPSTRPQIRSVHTVARHMAAVFYSEPTEVPQTISSSRGGVVLPRSHPSLHPNRHFDQFGRFCRAHVRDQHKDHAIPVCSNRLHPELLVLRCDLIMSVICVYILYGSNNRMFLWVCFCFCGLETTHTLPYRKHSQQQSMNS